jgi:hypothetical protein
MSVHISKYYLLEQDAILYEGSYPEESVAVSDCAALCIKLHYSEDGGNTSDLTDCSLSVLTRQTPVTATRIPLRAFEHIYSER